MSSTPHPTPFLQAIALSGGPGASPLIRGLTHTWCAGVHWVCGDEGSGKTTLLRLLAGDLPPMSGQVKQPDGGVFWLDFKGSEHDTLTVQACWNALQPRWPQWNEALLQELAQALDMDRHRQKQLYMLSTGSRRKVMLIAALSCGAAVTLLDQPFVSLDAVSINTLKGFLDEAAEHPLRTWIVADYEAPPKGSGTQVLNLDALAS